MGGLDTLGCEAASTPLSEHSSLAPPLHLALAEHGNPTQPLRLACCLSNNIDAGHRIPVIPVHALGPDSSSSVNMYYVGNFFNSCVRSAQI